MQIILAGPRGFCAGVNMAIESLETALRLYGTPDLRLPRNRPQPLGRRAVSPAGGGVRRRPCRRCPPGRTCSIRPTACRRRFASEAARRGLHTIDATCPLVTKVHREAVRFAAAGYTIILIGHAGHDEVVGVMGEAPGAFLLVQTPEDVDRLEVADPGEAGLPDADDAFGDDAARTIAAAARAFSQDRRAAEGRHLLRHAEPAGGGPARCRARPTWCWSWAARTARTAGGWPRWPGTAACRRT